jgi:hypothetical protein
MYNFASKIKYAISCDTSSEDDKNLSSNENSIGGQKIQGSDLKIISYANVCKMKPIEKSKTEPTIEERTWYKLLVLHE